MKKVSIGNLDKEVKEKWLRYYHNGSRIGSPSCLWGSGQSMGRWGVGRLQEFCGGRCASCLSKHLEGVCDEWIEQGAKPSGWSKRTGSLLLQKRFIRLS
jgi:hypothetical protein